MGVRQCSSVCRLSCISGVSYSQLCRIMDLRMGGVLVRKDRIWLLLMSIRVSISQFVRMLWMMVMKGICRQVGVGQVRISNSVDSYYQCILDCRFVCSISSQSVLMMAIGFSSVLVDERGCCYESDMLSMWCRIVVWQVGRLDSEVLGVVFIGVMILWVYCGMVVQYIWLRMSWVWLLRQGEQGFFLKCCGVGSMMVSCVVCFGLRWVVVVLKQCLVVVLVLNMFLFYLIILRQILRMWCLF